MKKRQVNFGRRVKAGKRESLWIKEDEGRGTTKRKKARRLHWGGKKKIGQELKDGEEKCVGYKASGKWRNLKRLACGRLLQFVDQEGGPWGKKKIKRTTFEGALKKDEALRKRKDHLRIKDGLVEAGGKKKMTGKPGATRFAVRGLEKHQGLCHREVLCR